MKMVERLIPPGPRLTADQAREVVDQLRQAAKTAVPLVAEASGLPPASGRVLVVTRASWVTANLALARRLLPDAGAQLGGLAVVLGALSSRVLGQYDPTVDTLFLNAPTIVAIERDLGVEPADFRLWVCLHEQTHRAQFAAAPWLLDELQRLAQAATQVTSKTAGSVLDEANGLMSLLEGHADVVMDRAELASTVEIREKFSKHRSRPGLLSVLGRVIGLDRKLAQYREGAEFCRQVLAAGGVDLVNVAFAAPENRPTLAEIRQPQEWIARHG